MEDILLKALIGAVGSSPIAGVLIWRLRVADARILALELAMALLVEEHTKFFKEIITGKKEEK